MNTDKKQLWSDYHKFCDNCSFFMQRRTFNYEGISLLENAAHLGLSIPEKLKLVLEQIHDKAEEKEGKEFPCEGGY